MKVSQLTQEDLLAVLRAHFSQLAAEYGVSRFVQLVEDLETLLGRKVDVLTPAGIDGIRVKRVAQNITDNIIYV